VNSKSPAGVPQGFENPDFSRSLFLQRHGYADVDQVIGDDAKPHIPLHPGIALVSASV
jgi:hypothetical protein